VPFEHPILKLRINSEKKMLLLVTKEKTDFFLYKVPLKKGWDFHSRTPINLKKKNKKKKKRNWALMALWKNGDVAFTREADILIYKPFSSEKVPEQSVCAVNPGKNGNWFTCFVGKDESLFAYYGKEFPEIAFACCSCTSGD
jgi:hypothetical protein